MSLLFFVVPMGSAEDVKAERREYIDAEFNAQAETEDAGNNVASKRVGESLLAHEASESNLGEANVAENIPENGNNDTENIPTEIRGKEEREAFHLVPVERTTEELYNSDLDQQEIDAFVQANIDEINRDIEKHSKKQPKMGANIAAYKAAKEQWQVRSADLNARLSYYQSLQQHIADITRSEMGEAKRAAGEQAENISTPTELVAGYLEDIKITPDSFKRETGLGSAEQKALVGIIATEKAGGVSVERAAEIIAENYAEELAGAGFNGDIQDIRNMIIEVLADGNPRTYANRGRRQRSQQAAEQQIGEMEAFTRATFGMELDEYIAYEETILPRIIEQYANFDEQTYYSILADENYNNHDTTRESETTGRGSEILQGEQSVPASGAASLRAGNEGRTVSNDVQSGAENAVAQGENQIGEPVGETDTLSSSEIPNNQFVAEGDAPGRSGVALSDEVDKNGRQFVLNSKGEIAFGEISEDSGLTPAPILLSEGLITNTATNDGYGLVHIEARHGDQIRNAGYNSVVDFVEEVAKNYEVIREGKDRNGQQTYVLQLTDKHNNTLMVELSGDGTYWNINTAGIFKTSYGKNRKEVYNRHTTAKQPTETVEASQDAEQSGTQATSSMNAPTTSAGEDTAPVSNSQENEQKSGENSQSEGEKDVIDEVREQNRIAEERVKRAGYPPRFSDYSTAIANGDTEAMKQWEDKFNTYLGAMNADDLYAIESTIREMQGRKSEIKAGNPEGYKENPNYKTYDYIEKALKKRKRELEQSSTNVEKSQGIEDKSTNDGDVSTLSQESEQETEKNVKRQLLNYPNRDIKKLIKSIEEAMPHYAYTLVHTTDKKKFAEAERDYRYYSLVLSLAKEVLQERNGGSWKTQYGVNLSYNKDITIEDLKILFENLNGDKAVAELFNKVYNVAKKLGLRIKISDQLSAATGTAGNDGIVKYGAALFYRNDIVNQKKAGTLLHELIHATTMYATTLHRNRTVGGVISEMYNGLPAEIKGACAELERIFDLVKDNEILKGEYGAGSVDEMVAELSNSEFRGKLKQIGVWERIVNAIKRLFDFPIKTDKQRASDALTEAERVLETMLDNFDKSTYDEVRNRIQAAGRGRKRSVAPKAELQQGALPLGTETPAFRRATEQTMQALEKTGIEVVMATEEQVQAVLGNENAERQMISDANERFNRELQQQIDGTLPKGHVYKLGMPSAVLQSAGLPYLPIELASSRLSDKSMQENHPFDLSEVEGLVDGVQNPLAVFRSATHVGSFVVLTEIQHEGKNFVAAIETNRRQGRIEINSVRSVYPKNNAQVANWIEEGLLEYADKKRMSEWFSKQRSNSADVRNLFRHSAKIVESFENPKVSTEFSRVYHGSSAKFDRFDHSFMGTGEGAQAYGWGTYVTEVEGIGRTYATSMRDKAISEKHRENAIINKLARTTLASNNGDKNAALEYLRSLLNEDWSDKKRVKAQIKILETGKFLPETKVKANLYTVEIPDDNGSNYLRWEEVISDEVIDNLQNVLQNEVGEDIAWSANLKHGQSGEHLYRKLERALGSDKAASEFLSRAGFVGISYPAQATTGGRTDGARNYVIFNENDTQITDRVEFLRTPNGTVYGWTVGGRIYLTPEGVNPNTPVHEYTHLWASAIEKSDPKLWASIVRGMKESPVWNEIGADEAYRDIWNDDNRMASEVLSRLTGEEYYRRAMERAEAEIKSAPNPTEAAKKITIWERLKRALNDFWNKVKTMLDQPATGKPKGDEPEWMEFVNSAIGDFYKGVNPNVENPGVEFAKRESERRKEKNRVNSILDEAVGFFTIGGKRQAAKNRLKREAERKQLAEELYTAVLKGDFNDVTLERINKYIEDATPNNPFGNRISQRLPQRMERGLRARERTSAVDALFSRISESAISANGRFSEAGRRAIEEKKKELLRGWAIATGNWHTDLKEFTDDIEPIGEGKDSKVYTSKDGRYVIKASKGKSQGKKFRPDIDNIPLFNDVFPNSRYEILGYGEIDGEFVRILKQPIVDFAESTPLTPEERAEYMSKLGFKPLNKDYTAFSDGVIVIADLQKSNIVKDAEGNVRVIDADAKLHTKDVGGSYTYPAVETDLPGKSSPNQRALKITENFNRTHKGAAATVIIDNNGTLDEQLRLRGFAEDDIDTAIKMFDNGTIAAYFPTDDRVLIFNADASESEINGYLWHENAHRAIGELYTDEEVETIFKNVVGEQEQDIRREFAGMNYEESQQAEEFVVRLLEDLYLAHPDLVESGKFKVNDDDFKWNVAVDSIKPLINYINNGDREKARRDIDTRLGRTGLGIFNVEVESEKTLEVRNSGTQKQDEQRTERYTDSIEDSDNISTSQEDGNIRYRSIGGNSGYVGYSMSKRAAEAREEGRFPKTDFKKEYNMPGSTFDALVAAGIIDNGEWHHTSKFGNKTVFYGWADDAYADFYAEHKAEVDAMVKGENIDGSLFVAEVEENPYTEQRVIIPEGYWEQRRSLENEGMTYDRIDEILKERFPELYAASENNRKFHEFESEISSARYENEKIISNRLTALFDEDRGGVMFRGDDSIEAANERFNRELDAFKEKRHKGLLHLGRPGAVLSAAGVNAEELTVSPKVLNRKMEQHGLTADDLKGLAEAVQSPILVYKHGDKVPNLVVVTELDVKDGKLSVAIELDDAGNVVEINNVSSVHSKDAATELSRLAKMGEEGLQRGLRWVEKEKAQDWLGVADLNRPMHTDNPELISVANVIENFENPSIEEDFLNDEDVISSLQRDEADREITDAVTSLAARLNTEVEIITSTGEITDDDAERLQRKRASKGWYEPKSGKVVIVLPNNFSVQDAVETVLHEVVGHDGLRRVFGRGFDRFLDDVFMTGSTEACFGAVFLYYQMIKNFCKFSYYEKYILHLQCKKKKGALAHLARAFDWQSKGDEFESRMLHKKRIYAINSIDSFLLFRDAKCHYLAVNILCVPKIMKENLSCLPLIVGRECTLFIDFSPFVIEIN